MSRTQRLVTRAALLVLAGCTHVPRVELPPLSANARALRFARLVDGDGTITNDATIIVDGDRIVSVGSGDRDVPHGVSVVDLRRYTAIPGMIDVHTHMTYWWDHAPGTKPFGPGGTRRTPAEVATVAMENARLTLQTGVTTVRDLGASGYADLMMRDKINRGEAIGPRMFVAGYGLSKSRPSPAPTTSIPPSSIPPSSISPSPAWLRGRITSISEIPLAVKTQADSGADVIKMYGSTGTGADTSGVQTFSYEEMKAAVDAAHALGKRIAIHSYGPNGGRDAVRAGTNTLEHSVDLDDATLALMVKQGTIYVPTIDHNRYYADFRADYGYTDDQARGLDAFRARNTESARRAIKAGVKVAMGSDAVHMMFGQNTRELGLLVQAGMTPLGALRAATITGAEVLGMQDRIGRVARGYYADIAAVEGNPATDVNATIYGVKWVMKGGKVVVDKRAAPAPPPSEPARATPSLDYAIGADLSFLADAEAKGVQFKDANRVLPGLQLFRDHGYNWIRLRVFHTVANSPMVLPNDLPYTLALAQKAKALGYKFLLDFHYSDTWADPQHQIIPRAWENLSDSALATAVEDYSRRTIAALREGGALPDMVQVGNEITVGMMWPRARLPQNWDLFCDLLKAGIRGIDEGRGVAPRPLIMIHIDQGGNRDATQWFFDNVMQRGVEFDVIGQSYYPFWHGTLLDLRENLRLTAERYRKPIVVVETAYSWRPSNYITAAGPFPETPAGQRDFLEAVNEAVLATPYGLGRGVMWWEPAVSDPSLVGRGMFDADHNALPVITVFDKYTRGKPARQ